MQAFLGFGKLFLGCLDLLVGVVDERGEGGGLFPAGENLVHRGAERAHQPLEGAHALLGMGERGAVEIDVVAVPGHISRHILHDEAGLSQGCGIGGEFLVDSGGLVEQGNGAVEGVEGSSLVGEGRGSSVGVAGERLGVLGAAQVLAHLLVFAGARVHALDVLQGEAGLVELGVGGAGPSPDGFQGSCRLGMALEGHAIGSGGIAGLAGPCV